MPPTVEIRGVFAPSPRVAVPTPPLSAAAKEHQAALARLAHSSESSIVFQGVVDKEDSQPWRHVRESHRHDYASGARWHSNLHLTLLNDGTLICSGVSRDEMLELHQARASATSPNAFDASLPASPTTSKAPTTSSARADVSAGGVSTPSSKPQLRRLTTAFPSSHASRASKEPPGQTSVASRASSYQANFVQVSGALCIPAPPGVTHGKRKYGFIIRTRRRDDFFACLEAEEVAEWVDCINDACAALKGYSRQRQQKGHTDHQISPPAPVQSKRIMHSIASAQQLSSIKTLSMLTSFQRQLHRQSLESSRESDASSTPSLTPTLRANESSDWESPGRSPGRVDAEALTGLSAALARAAVIGRSPKVMGEEDGEADDAVRID